MEDGRYAIAYAFINQIISHIDRSGNADYLVVSEQTKMPKIILPGFNVLEREKTFDSYLERNMLHRDDLTNDIQMTISY